MATASAVLLGGVYISSATASPPSDPPPQPGQQWAGILDDSGRKKLRIRQDDVEFRVTRRSWVVTNRRRRTADDRSRGPVIAVRTAPSCSVGAHVER